MVRAECNEPNEILRSGSKARFDIPPRARGCLQGVVSIPCFAQISSYSSPKDHFWSQRPQLSYSGAFAPGIESIPSAILRAVMTYRGYNERKRRAPEDLERAREILQMEEGGIVREEAYVDHLRTLITDLQEKLFHAEIQRDRDRQDLLEQVKAEKYLGEMRRQNIICLEAILNKQAQEIAELRDKCGDKKEHHNISDSLQFEENIESNHNIEYIKVLGKGVNGIAHLIYFDGTLSVQKIALRGNLDKKEIAMMHHLNGAGGAPQILAASETSLVCEYVGDLTLENVMRGPILPSRTLIHMLFKVAHGVKEIHQKGICHNDLKQDNVVLNRHTGNCHLIDFGLSCGLNEQMSPVSNPFEYDRLYWMAPEVRLGLPATTASDMFSLGVMFDDLMYRQYIDDKDLFEICRRAKSLNAFRRPNIDEMLSVLKKHF